MKYPIPEAALRQHIIALGKTGSGKSSKLRVLVEWLLDVHRPVCIIDPKGDWWGLKSSADGKAQGYPLVIFGGEHADVQINEHSGAHVAELVATGNRSALIDLGGWMIGERTRLFIDFASAYFKIISGERTLVLPEVHNFAPKGKIMDPAAGKMLHWANRLASEGRGKGLTILADSQRPQKVHNDFLTSCETLIACRVIHKADRDAIKDWVDGCADPAAGKQLLTELAQMKRTDAWCWSPENDFGPERITWPMFKTFDSFKPQPERATRMVGWASVDLEEVKSKLSKVVEEAKANDPAELKKQIRDLQQQLANGVEPAVDEDTIRAREQETWGDGHATGKRDGAAEVAREIVRNAQDMFASMVDAARTITQAIETARETFAEMASEAEQAATRIGARPENPLRSGLPPSRPAVAAHRAEPNRNRADGARARQIDGRAPASDGVLSKAMPRAIMSALAQHPKGLTKRQVLTFAGYRASGDISTFFAEADRNGWTRNEARGLVITPEGLAALGPYEPLPMGADLRRSLLNGGGLSTMEKAILRVLFDAYPGVLAKSEILERAGYKPSGDISTAFAKFVTLGYAQKEGRELRACEDLF